MDDKQGHSSQPMTIMVNGRMERPKSSSGRKHVPTRMCIVCREKEEKRTLTRLVRTDSGVQIDPSGKMNGRGAYLCRSKSCWERAMKTSILDKALRMTLTDEDRERLKQAMM